MDLVTILAAIIPAIFIVFLIYKKDKREHEPIRLLLKLFFLGVLSIPFALLIEVIGEKIENLFTYEGSHLYNIIDSFLIVAMAEELGKYLAFKFGAYKNKNFDFTFDGIVYGACIGIGFAIPENLMYVLDGGLSLAIMRAFTSIPGHIAFGVYMGYYFGQGKACEWAGDAAGRKKFLTRAFVIPVLLHGCYDFLLSYKATLPLIAFVIFDIVFDIYAIKLVLRASRDDRRIDPRPHIFVNNNEFISRGLLPGDGDVFSYLVSDTDEKGAWVVTQMSDTATEAYDGTDKLKTFIDGYNRLSAAGVTVPQLFEADMQRICFAREYIEGPTLKELGATGSDMLAVYLGQLREMGEKMKGSGATLIPDLSKYIACNGKLYCVSFKTMPETEENLAAFENVLNTACGGAV